MRILHLISSSGMFGAERVLLEICKSAKENGNSSYLACLRNSKKEISQIHLEAEKIGLESKVFFCRNKLDLAVLFGIKNFVKENKIALIHSHGYKSNLYGLLAARLSGVPIISTLHGWTSETPAVKFYERLDKRIVRWMDHVIAVSPVIADELKTRGFKSEKVTLIPNGTDIEKYDPLKTPERDLRRELGIGSCVVIGTVGRLSREKDHINLIRAFGIACVKAPNARLLIVGDGPLKDELKKETKSLRIADKVIFIGFCEDMVSVYRAMDIFVLPSLTEGLPLVLLEAMSMELAVIATDVGAVRYVISDPKDGIVIPAEDPYVLAKDLTVLLKDAGTRKEMGKRARESVAARFSAKTVYQKYSGLYRKIAGTNIHNALTIDVEDYYQVSNFESIVKKEDWDKYESRVYKNTQRILDILDEYKTKATFFILGWTAEKFPELVAEIDSRGHEIASHGYWHKLVYDLTKEEFADDLARSLKILEGITGKKVLGFRAASCSITKDSLWALDILKEYDMRYDASVFPVHHDRYGIPDADRFMTKWRNNGLTEFPFSTIGMLGHNLPVAGGGYFRLYPYWFTRWAINRINAAGHPAMVYIHPWEIDDKQPRMKGGVAANFRHYVNLKKNEGKIRRLLSDFEFTTVKNLI